MAAHAVSELHQLAQRMEWKLEFTVSDPEGPSHDPTIHCLAKLTGGTLPQEGLQVKTSGGSKSKAKAQAAMVMLSHHTVLEAVQEAQAQKGPAVMTNLDTLLSALPDSPANELNVSVKANYKGLLMASLNTASQMAGKLQCSDLYNCNFQCRIHGDCHRPTFVAEVVVKLPQSTYTGVGMGRKKREAEQLAAAKVLCHPEVKSAVVSLSKRRKLSTAAASVADSPNAGNLPCSSASQFPTSEIEGYSDEVAVYAKPAGDASGDADSEPNHTLLAMPAAVPLTPADAADAQEPSFAVPGIASLTVSPALTAPPVPVMPANKTALGGVLQLFD